MKSFIKKLIYNPYRAARRDPRVKLEDSTILLDSARFCFHGTGGSVRLGGESMVGCNFIFESDQGEIAVGDHTYIGGGTQLISRDRIFIGSNVTIAWGVYVYDHNSHSVELLQRKLDIERQNLAYRSKAPLCSGKDWSVVKSAPITIGDGAWIGFEAVILKGVTIGEGAIVAARSVVTKNVPSWSVVAGNPAVVVRENIEK